MAQAAVVWVQSLVQQLLNAMGMGKKKAKNKKQNKTKKNPDGILLTTGSLRNLVLLV